MKITMLTLLLPAAAALLKADGPGVILSRQLRSDFTLTANPKDGAWAGAKAVIADRNNLNQATPGHRTEIRSCWTARNIYFHFVCPYEELYLHPNPSTTEETNKLWEYDAAEVFVGWDFQHIRQYKEFQVSPQGEWVDLDIDRDFPKPEGGWRWNSGFEVKASIDKARKIWYGAMRIPWDKIDQRPPRAGQELRINFYRFQGPPPNRRSVAWQPTGVTNNHTPEAFGRLRIEGR
jgi:hypothetical protein